MRQKAASVSTAKPDEGALELTEELIRVRAYQFYQERGCEDGHDFDDWLQAEAEIFGKKLAASAEADDRKGGSRAAGA